MGRDQTFSKTRRRTRSTPQSTVTAPTSSPLAGKSLLAILCALLAAATVALYSPALHYSFVSYDDRDYVTDNLHVQQGLSWNTIKWAFTTFTAGNWHPLTWLSHALDCQIFALNPAGHHFDSIFLHALNAVVLFVLFAWLTRRVGASLLVAALFAVHPLNLESVAWVAERKNLLSTLFFFAAIGAYAWYARQPDWRRYVLVMVMFAAGLMAKPMVITLPFVLLLLDYWPLERTPIKSSAASSSGQVFPRMSYRNLLLEKIPLLLLAVASAWVTVLAQRSGQAVGSLHQFPLSLRIENALLSYGLYLWKMIWPARLAVLYPYSSANIPAWQWVFGLIVLIGITAFVVIFRNRRYLPVGWFWFLGTLVPVIGLVQVGFATRADRYTYIPLIGIFVMIAWALDDWAKAKEIRLVWLALPALCVLSALAFSASNQLSNWENKYTLWRHALAVTAQNSFAHEAMAAALMDPTLAATAERLDGFDTEEKRTDASRQHYEEALKIHRQLAQQNPQDYVLLVTTTLNQIGVLDEKQGHLDEARRYYAEALDDFQQLARDQPNEYLPQMATTLNNLGNLDRLQDRPNDAHQHIASALGIYRQLAQRDPDTYLPVAAEWLDKLGLVDRLQNHPDDAQTDYTEALKIQRQLAERSPAALPDLAKTLIYSGLLDAAQKRYDDARQKYDEALKIYRQLGQQNSGTFLAETAATLGNLGNLDRQQNKIDDARLQYQACLRTYRQLAANDPGRALAEMVTPLGELGDLYLHQNQVGEARECYEEQLNVYRQLAQHDPGKYLPDVAQALAYVGFLNQKQDRILQSRADYQEALALFKKLLQGDNHYAADTARVEKALAQLR
jgi:tetratricopeptide (TPR) repeat protein